MRRTYGIPSGVIHCPRRPTCVLICLAQIAFLFFDATDFLGYGRIAETFCNAANDGDRGGDIFHKTAKMMVS